MSNSEIVNNLKSSWDTYRLANPSIRIRDAAKVLDVSEAELVATGCGDSVTRLKPAWYEMLLELEGLGEVMGLTRNEVFIHEKVGRYENASAVPGHQMGQVLDKNIDLRIFFRNWHFAFAVLREKNGDVKRSLQFFDQHGHAVHKIHLRSESNLACFEEIVHKYHHEDQSPEIDVQPAPIKKAELPDSEVDQQALKEAWSTLEDTHQFIFLLRKFKVSRQQAFRIAGPDFARPVETASLRHVLEGAAAVELPLMIFVRNPGCVQIHSGPVRRLKASNGWYNVLDPGFSLHVKDGEIASSWIVKKPVESGWVHSLEYFDDAGEALCYIFSKRKEGQHEMASWRALIQDLV